VDKQRTDWTRIEWRRTDTWPHPEYLTDRTPTDTDEDTDND
jgi:hypothetical protein